MATQPLQSSSEVVLQSDSFDLDRGFNAELNQTVLSLKLKFPWHGRTALRADQRGCPELIKVLALREADQPILILEDFECFSLDARLQKEAMPARDAFVILRHLAAAVDQLHACGLVHGALRPSGILIGQDLNLRIIDWMVDWNRVPTEYLREAAEYLSPERLANLHPGPAADQFSFAIIAYRLLAGRTPFPGEGLAENLFRLRYSLFDDAVFAEMGSTGYAVFARAFSFDPSQRFESCSALLSEIEKAPQQRIYAETRLLDVSEEQDDYPIPIGAATQEEQSNSGAGLVRLTAWWIAAAVSALLAFGLGVGNWYEQRQIDQLETAADRLNVSSSAGSILQNGQFRVCNASAEGFDIRELAVAYWDSSHNLRVFNSNEYSPSGWKVAPASSQLISWPLGQKNIWDGSVLLYYVQVQQGQKEFNVSGRWSGGAQGCLQLPPV
jgi:serine/threonine protein kinase